MTISEQIIELSSPVVTMLIWLSEIERRFGANKHNVHFEFIYYSKFRMPLTQVDRPKKFELCNNSRYIRSKSCIFWPNGPEKIFELSDNSSYTTSSYAEFTVPSSQRFSAIPHKWKFGRHAIRHCCFSKNYFGCTLWYATFNRILSVKITPLQRALQRGGHSRHE